MQLAPGTYTGQWFNATSGQWIPVDGTISGPSWSAAGPPEDTGWPSVQDWALLIRKQ